MSKRLKLEVLILIILAVFSGGYFYLSGRSDENRIISGEDLQKFYEITEKDGLFYDPHLDEDFLMEAVKELQKTDAMTVLTSRRHWGSRNNAILPAEWHLWPTEFWIDVVFINRKTKKFLDSPNEETALFLLGWYRRAAADYEKEINSQIKAMQSLLAAKMISGDAKIFFLGSATTPEIVLSDLLLIKENANALKDEIERRYDCLYSGKCAWARPSIEIPDASAAIDFNPLPQEFITNGINKILNGVYYASSKCWGGDESGASLAFPFYIISSEKYGKNIMEPKMTNEIYYEDYQKVSVSNKKRADLFLDAGVPWVRKSETSYYRCTDLSFAPRLLSMYLWREDLIKSGAVIDQEKKFYKTDKVSEQQVFEIMLAYKHILGSGNIGKNEREVIKKRLAVLENQLGSLPYLFQGIAGSTRFLIDGEIALEKSVSPQYLLTTRTGYSLFFGVFSPSMWRLEEHPGYLLKIAGTLPLEVHSTYSELQNNSEFQKFLKTSHPTLNEIFGI